MNEGFVEVQGGKIWYRIAGKDNPGTPLLVVHGGPGANHEYLLTLEALANERPVIFYDQLGCGESENPEDTAFWTVDRYAAELDLLIRELKLKEVFLLGQSWGGALVGHYMITYKPDFVKGIIFSAPLISTSRWYSDQQFWLSQLPAEIQAVVQHAETTGDFSSPEYAGAMNLFYSKHLCRLDPWPELLTQSFEKLNVNIYNYLWGYSEFSITGTLKNFDISLELNEIDLPVLFTCGEYDEARPETCEYFASLMPNAQVHIFENASHAHHIEAENEFNQRITEFMNNIGKSSQK
jgi:proline iminopeptidase